MLISTGNELDFHFGVRHGSTHAELEIKTAFMIPVVQNIFGFFGDVTNISTPVIG